MKLSESTILATTTIITGFAALFALIGLTTPKWLRIGYGLWNCDEVCSPSTAALAILALLLLVTSVVLLVILAVRLFPRKLRIIPLGFLIIATLFLLMAPAIYLRRSRLVGYSFELMVTAHAFAFFASVLLAFWFGTTMNEKAVTKYNEIDSTITKNSFAFIMSSLTIKLNRTYPICIYFTKSYK